mmetsp:Transcript_46609/g.141189  ORF Transcript_46609/g.141189 Transcript_46609/m.141189 type:complete len:111 (-) Transcript_46609:2531-2863(-)
MVNSDLRLYQFVNGEATNMLGAAIFERRAALFEVNAKHMTPSHFVGSLQNRHLIHLFDGEVNDRGISGAHKPPLRPEVRIEYERAPAVRVRAHRHVLDERVTVRVRAFQY